MHILRPPIVERNYIWPKYFLSLSLCFLFFSFQVINSQKPVLIFKSRESPGIDLAVSDIVKSLEENGFQVEVKSFSHYNKTENNSKIVLSLIDDDVAISAMGKLNLKTDNEISEEGFCIRSSSGKNPVIWVSAKDIAGIMYGGFELAEQLRFHGIKGIASQTQNPYMKMRGVKFNIPLDVRTPSYSDYSDAAQRNIAEVWNFDFWKEYIDKLASYRYNFVSLWSLHPFPSMVKVPEYPDIALSDVRKTTSGMKEFYSLNGIGFNDPEVLRNYEVVKEMSIEEKTDFWRKVMAYGKERNVKFFIITWNIFTYGVDGKYGITDDVDNPVTRDYFRKSVRQMLLDYPDLAGIGLTTGENMYGIANDKKEAWAYDTYGLGVLDVAEIQPERKITLIHRQHQAGAREIADRFKTLRDKDNIDFIFSFKYAKAHVYSSVNQTFHEGFLKDLQQAEDLKTIWTLRNDDNYYFRWGAPDFVRDFIRNIPYDRSEGYYFGSDNYVWGRDFLSRDLPEDDLEINRQWYQWMMWGRLGYNPEMTNDNFIDLIGERFPEGKAGELFSAWGNASMIYPLVTGFHWGSLDFQWYIESAQSAVDPARTPSGYHDVNRFISLSPHPGTDYIPISDYQKAIDEGSIIEGTTPPELAAEIIERSDMALQWATGIDYGNNEEFFRTINDIQSMAYLGKYYAHKILAAMYLERFRINYNPADRQALIDELKQSALNWRYYASVSLSTYNNPLWTNRTGYVDWKETFRYVLYDITANGGDLIIPSMEATPGGMIMEAEDSEFSSVEKQSAFPGFTGTGYLESTGYDAKQKIRWNLDMAEEGEYILEFRYSLNRQEIFSPYLKINEKENVLFHFWPTGSPRNWVWDRTLVHLEKGKNSIELEVEGFVLFDHLNVIKKFKGSSNN